MSSSRSKAGEIRRSHSCTEGTPLVDGLVETKERGMLLLDELVEIKGGDVLVLEELA